MDYKNTLTEARKRLGELTVKRNEIDLETQAVLRIIQGAEIATQPAEPEQCTTAGLPDDLESVGFTDKVRLVLSRSSVPLTPTEIRDGLEIMNVEGASPKNVLIHVHNVLRRLLENDEVGQVPRDGKMGYRMLSPLERFGHTIKGFGEITITKPPTREKT